MPNFISYGPVDEEDHFYVSRDNLISDYVRQLIGNQQKGGHGLLVPTLCV